MNIIKKLLSSKNLIIIVISIIVIITVVATIQSEEPEEIIVNNNETIEVENENNSIIPKETKLVDILKYDNSSAKVIIDIKDYVDLRLSSTDDIIITSINKTTNKIITQKNKAINNYLIDQQGNQLGRESQIPSGTYNAVFEAYELDNQPIENIVINLKVIKENKEIHNSNITYSRFGQTGHIDIKSVPPNITEFGTKYKWELTNPTMDKRANIKITTLDETQVLASIDINPMETINILTDSIKGNKLKVHTRQGDNTYVVKEISVDENFTKFEDVDVEYIDPDPNTYGTMLRYKIKNQNTNGVAHVIVKDAAGFNILDFALDVNNQKVVSIDVNRGQYIIVETRMKDGTYSSKQYNMPPIEEKHVTIELLGPIENNNANISQVEIENTIEGRTNIIIATPDGVTNIAQFDLNPGEKRVIDINLDYTDSIMVKTKQANGAYSFKLYQCST